MPDPFAHPASVAVHDPSACSTNFQSDDAHGPGDVCRNVRLARSQPSVVGGSVVPGAGVLAHPNSDDTTIATAPNPADVRVVMNTLPPGSRRRGRDCSARFWWRHRCGLDCPRVPGNLRAVDGRGARDRDGGVPAEGTPGGAAVPVLPLLPRTATPPARAAITPGRRAGRS